MSAQSQDKAHDDQEQINESNERWAERFSETNRKHNAALRRKQLRVAEEEAHLDHELHERHHYTHEQHEKHAHHEHHHHTHSHEKHDSHAESAHRNSDHTRGH